MMMTIIVRISRNKKYIFLSSYRQMRKGNFHSLPCALVYYDGMKAKEEKMSS